MARSGQMLGQPPRSDGPRILFATSELRPLVSVGGLGEAAAGLTAALPAAGVGVLSAIPAYRHWDIDEVEVLQLDVPEWAAPARARQGRHPEAGLLAIIEVPGIERSDPYVDAFGEGWADNTERFAAFSAAVAALAVRLDVDLVHLNDWHTAMVPAFLPDTIPTILTIHNIAHQGWAPADWLHRMPSRRELFRFGDAVNSLAGAIKAASRIVAVSPGYANEILTVEFGSGLEGVLRENSERLVGILNGIDTRAWDPATDVFTPHFSAADLSGKAEARADLLHHVGWDDTGEPIVVMVTRLVEQKGVDLAFAAARYLDGMKARLIVLGSGEVRFADWARWLAAEQPHNFWFHDGYDAAFSQLLFAGGDLLLMPSRFEPCGLAQMQAMAYGTLPVVTPVGGLNDTVVDADRIDPANADGGVGFVAADVSEAAVVDALHRALRSVRHARRRAMIQRRGMQQDWSWREPAHQFAELYHDVLSEARQPG